MWIHRLTKKWDLGRSTFQQFHGIQLTAFVFLKYEMELGKVWILCGSWLSGRCLNDTYLIHLQFLLFYRVCFHQFYSLSESSCTPLTIHLLMACQFTSGKDIASNNCNAHASIKTCKEWLAARKRKARYLNKARNENYIGPRIRKNGYEMIEEENEIY